MDDITRRLAAVAFAVSLLAATAGVGVAYVGTADSGPTADTVVEPRNVGPSDESPRADRGGDHPSNGPNGGKNDREREGSDESEESDDSSAGREKSTSGAAGKSEAAAENKAEKAKGRGERKSEEANGESEREAGRAKERGEKRAEKARSRGASTARVERETRGEAANSTVDFRVRNASANETVSLRVGPPRNASNGTRANGNATGEGSSPAASDDGMAVDELSLRTNSGGDFTVNVTTGREAFETTPRFERDDGVEAVGHIRVDHSVPDENITRANFTFRLSRERLAEATVAPEDVALYRYHGGTWNELETAVVNETPDGVVFRAESPGLSEFAAGAKRPKFELGAATVDVSKVVRGDSVYVNVNVSNVGSADGTFTADLVLNDMVVDSKEVTIAAGGSRRIVFERTFDYPGTYDVRVNGVFAGTVVVAERPANETASRTPPRSTARPSGGGGIGRVGVRALVDAVGEFTQSASETVRRFGR